MFPRDMVCLRNIRVDTLHKGDINDDDDDNNNNNNNNNNNKAHIIIRDNEKRTCMLIDDAISGDRNVIKKRSRENSKISRPCNRNTTHVDC